MWQGEETGRRGGGVQQTTAVPAHVWHVWERRNICTAVHGASRDATRRERVRDSPRKPIAARTVARSAAMKVSNASPYRQLYSIRLRAWYAG